MITGPAWSQKLRTEIGKAVIGQEAVIERMLVALLANGHVLLEGMPGLAKTLLIKSLGAAPSASRNRREKGRMAGSTAEKIRAFIALAPERGLIAELQNVQRQLQTRLPVGIIRWAMPEQLHLTLKFLGGVPGERLAGLAAALDRAGAGIAPFQLALEGVGCFPHAKNPRVVWVGIQGELHSLRKLQAQIEHETQPCGDHTEERPFRPHLTSVASRPLEKRRAKWASWWSAPASRNSAIGPSDKYTWCKANSGRRASVTPHGRAPD